MQENRGKIHNPERAAQLRDFSGLIFGTITPTDIDGLIECRNCGYVLMEFKSTGTNLLRGQELALERLTDDLTRSGKPTICIVAEHNTPLDEQIDAANTIVVKHRWDGHWFTSEVGVTTRELITRFLGFFKK